MFLSDISIHEIGEKVNRSFKKSKKSGGRMRLLPGIDLAGHIRIRVSEIQKGRGKE